MHNFFFFFRNLKVSILTQPVKKDNRIKDFPTDNTVPAEEYIINIVKLFENHSSAAPLTSHNISLFIPSSHHGYLYSPFDILLFEMQFFCQRFPHLKKI